MSEPVINCSPEIIADLERKIVTLQSKLERAELSEANLSVWKRSAEISIEAQADTISRLTADNEALRKERDEAMARGDSCLYAQMATEARADALAQEMERKDAALEAIRDFPKPGTSRRTEDGYPDEIVYDEFAYRRIVDSYREAARAALANEEAGR